MNVNLVLGWSEWNAAFSATLLHFLWQGALLGIIACAASRWLQSSAAKYALYLVTLLGMPACALLTFLALTGQTSESPTVTPVPAFVSRGDARPEAAADEGNASLGANAVQTQPGFVWRQWSPWMCRAYILGVTVFLLRLTVASIGVHRIRRQAELLNSADWIERIELECSRLGLAVVPLVALCQRTRVPTVVGFLRPMVLLPAELVAGMEPGQISAILRHEFVHIRRHDLAMNLLQRGIESLLFFHPAVWVVSRRLSLLREDCCDDEVVASGVDRVAYADVLLQIAESCAGKHSNALGLAAAGHKSSELESRIRRLLDMTRQSPLRFTRGGLVLIWLLLGPVVGMPVFVHCWAHPPQTSATQQPSARPPQKLAASWEDAIAFAMRVELTATVGKESKRAVESWLGFPKQPDAFRRSVLFDSTASVGWGRTRDHRLTSVSPNLVNGPVTRYNISVNPPQDLRPGLDQFTSRQELLQQISIHSEATCFLALKPLNDDMVEVSLSYLGLEFEKPLASHDQGETALYGVVTPKPIRRRVKLGEDVSIVVVHDPQRKAKKTVTIRVQAHSRSSAATRNPPVAQVIPDGAPRKGFKFLAGYPALRELSLEMTHQEFLDLVKRKNLRMGPSNDGSTYSIDLGDGHMLLVMFGNNGPKISGVQRLRGAFPRTEKDAGTKPDAEKRGERPGTGAAFLADYPALQGLKLGMARKEFDDMLRQGKLGKHRYVASAGGGTYSTYTIDLMDGQMLLVMFGDGQKVVGLQRMRGAFPADAAAVDAAQEAADTIQGIQKALSERTTFEFRRAPLHEVIESLGERWKIPMKIDRQSLKLHGMTVNQSVTVSIKDVSRETALNTMLNKLHLHYKLLDGVLTIQAGRP